MSKALAKIESQINNLDEKELRLLNRKIVDRLKLISSAKTLKSLSQFSVGELVSFEHFDETVIGRIIRVNKKTVSLVTLDNEYQWKVPPNILTKEDDFEDGGEAEKRPRTEPAFSQTTLPFTPDPKTPRNASCPCGSGKKFKHCCGKK